MPDIFPLLKRASVVFSCVFLCWTAAGDKIDTVLDEQRVDWNFHQVPLGDIISVIRLEQGIDISVASDVAQNWEKEEIKVTLRLEDVRLRDALEVLLEFYDLDYFIRDGTMVVTEPWSGDGIELRVYDVSRIVRNPEQIEKLAELIRATVIPESWDKNGVFLSHTEDGIVAMQCPRAHRKISCLLEELGRLVTPAQLSVEVKYLETADSIGTDLPELVHCSALSERTLAALDRGVADGEIHLLANCSVVVGSGQTAYIKREGASTIDGPAGDFSLAVCPLVYADRDRVLIGVTSAVEASAENFPVRHENSATMLIPFGKTAVACVATARPGRSSVALVRISEATGIPAIETRIWPRGIQPEFEQRIARIFKQQVRMEFAEAPLEEVVDFLRYLTGINILIAPAVYDIHRPEELKVDISVSDIALSSVLEILLDMKGLTYRVDNGGIVVIGPRSLYSGLYVTAYDVRPLLSVSRNAPENIAGKGPSKDSLVDFLQESVYPEKSQPNRCMVAIGGLVILAHEERTQLMLAGLIRQLYRYRLRQFRPVRVAAWVMTGEGEDVDKVPPFAAVASVNGQSAYVAGDGLQLKISPRVSAAGVETDLEIDCRGIQYRGTVWVAEGKRAPVIAAPGCRLFIAADVLSEGTGADPAAEDVGKKDGKKP